MKNNLKSQIILFCVTATYLIAGIVFSPLAQAETLDEKLKREQRKRDAEKKRIEQLDQGIIDSRNNMNIRDFGGGLFNLFFLLRPSLMYSTTGIGYGAQTTFRFSREGDVRFGLHLQPEITTWDFSTTYKFDEPGGMQPFIGGGWQHRNFSSNYTGNRDANLGTYLMAGVDIPLGNISKVSARINLPITSIVSLLPEMTPSESSTEFQVMVSLFDF
jgi:hypothetical protein